MSEFPSINNFWDISQTAPSHFSQLGDDAFLALLQKQFPNASPDISVNPQSIQKQLLSSLTPPSDESSPSPPSNALINESRSRVQSTFSRGNEIEELPLKRKASYDSMQEGPSSKNPHTANHSSTTTKSSASRRKSIGTTQFKDDSRMLKRKEQNRAAQRAFRERKEKHVKDLEDQLAALEAKNQDAQNENSNLRELLLRLQQENLALKQAQFTFSVPKQTDQSLNQSSSSPSNIQAPFSFFDTPPPALPPPAPTSQPSPKPYSDIDWSSLTTFDPSMLTAMDETPSGSMRVDVGQNPSPFGQYALPAPDQYKTLASNTFFMSFADIPESNSFNNLSTTTDTGNNNNNNSNNSNNGMIHSPFAFPSRSNSWNGARNSPSAGEFSQAASHPDLIQNNSLDELFGGTLTPLNFNVQMKGSTAHAPTPVTRSNTNGQSPQCSISTQNSATSPLSANPLSSPSSACTSNEQSPFSWTMSRPDTDSPPSASEPISTDMPHCPTRDDIARHIAASGDSPFTSSLFAQPAVRKTSNGPRGGGNIISCEGTKFPKTKESSANIEMLKAWRTITTHPQFKDADINELCSEFTKKARCDGTKVVLEPEGVHHIFETFKAKTLAQQQPQP